MSEAQPRQDAGLFAFDNTFSRLPGEFYTRLRPTPLPDPYLVAFNPSAAALVGLAPAHATEPGLIDILGGNSVPPGAGHRGKRCPGVPGILGDRCGADAHGAVPRALRLLDGFDWGHICTHSDDGGRYAYNMQPGVAHWNLYCLGQALLPLMELEEAEAGLQRYEPAFDTAYATRMRAKPGLLFAEEGDAELAADLLGLMHRSRTEFTIFFRSLCKLDSAEQAGMERFASYPPDWSGSSRRTASYAPWHSSLNVRSPGLACGPGYRLQNRAKGTARCYFAPRALSISAIGLFRAAVANVRAVDPPALTALMSARCSSRRSATSSRAYSAAVCRGVVPLRVRLLTSAPRESSRSIMSIRPFITA